MAYIVFEIDDLFQNSAGHVAGEVGRVTAHKDADEAMADIICRVDERTKGMAYLLGEVESLSVSAIVSRDEHTHDDDRLVPPSMFANDPEPDEELEDEDEYEDDD